MDFGLSQDQGLLVDSVRGFLADRVPIERVRTLREADCPNDRDIWRSLAELGVSGVLVDEEHGGSGLVLLDAVLLAQSLGYSVTPAPFVSSAVMAPLALAAHPGAQSSEWLRGIAAGEIAFGVAVTEVFSIREEAGVTLAGGEPGGRGEGKRRLHGKTMMALDVRSADFVLVAVAADRLAVVRRDSGGLEANHLATLDATRCTSELVFDGVEPEAVFEDAGDTIDRMLIAGRIALAADTLGACESMIEQAVAYSKERVQFNRVIGSFQAVKHMCAEMIAELEPARSLLWYAAHSFDSMPGDAPLMSCHVLAHVSEIAREIASVSTQVHGGTGWTDEQNLHFWFKRIAVARHLLGGPQFLRDRAAQIQGLDERVAP